MTDVSTFRRTVTRRRTVGTAVVAIAGFVTSLLAVSSAAAQDRVPCPVAVPGALVLALKQDDRLLGADDGPFQVIVPGEQRHARWVRQVACIRIARHR